MGRILIKLGENVGTLVRLIVLKFHRAKEVKRFFFFSFLYVLEHFNLIETLFFQKIFVSMKRKTRATGVNKI